MRRQIAFLLLGLVSFGLSLSWSGQAEAAAFAKYDGVDGEARDKDHKAWIDLLSVSGTPSLGTGATGTCPAAPPGPGEIVIVRLIDASTPKLQEATCSGEVAPEVVIHVHQSKRSQEAYIEWRLTRVRVTSYSVGTTPDKKGRAVPTEELTLNYEEIEWTYKPFKDE